MTKRKDEKEADSMTTVSVESNKESFLLELEESLKEMSERRFNNVKGQQSSWRDLFTEDKK